MSNPVRDELIAGEANGATGKAEPAEVPRVRVPLALDGDQRDDIKLGVRAALNLEMREAVDLGGAAGGLEVAFAAYRFAKKILGGETLEIEDQCAKWRQRYFAAAKKVEALENERDERMTKGGGS